MKDNSAGLNSNLIESFETGYFGLNFKYSSLEKREKFVAKFGEPNTLKKLFSKIFKEIILLSTCNRIEIYFIFSQKKYEKNYVAGHIRQTVKKLFPKTKYQGLKIHIGKSALTHLYKVACGIDSLVTGETEILSQLKTARLNSLENRLCGKILSLVFSRAEKFGSEIRIKLPISQGITSISFLVLKLIKENMRNLTNKKILIYGAGVMGRKAGLLIAKEHPQEIFLMNRTLSKATLLKKELSKNKDLKISVISEQNLKNSIVKSDVIIAASGAKNYVINQNNVPHTTEDKMFIDLSVPRNIDPKIMNKQNNVSLTNIDNFKRITNLKLEDRKKLASSVCLEIKTGIRELQEEMIKLENNPFLEKFSLRNFGIISEAINKAIRKEPSLNAKKQILTLMMKSTLNKLFYDYYLKVNQEDSMRKRQMLSTIFVTD